MAIEAFHTGLVDLLDHLFGLETLGFVFGERNINAEVTQHVELQSLEVVVHTELFDEVAGYTICHVHKVDEDALTHEGVATLGIDYFTLLVEHIVVFEQALTDAEVVLLDLLLRILDRLVEQRVLDHIVFRHTEHLRVHNLRNLVRTEDAHQVIFERNEEY